MPHKKGTQPLTLIVVPHSERTPISLCIPTWVVPALCAVTLSLFAGLGLLMARSSSLYREIIVLRQDKAIQLAREREMRDTILAQQEDVQGLSQQVDGFQTELAGVRTLSDDIRNLVGIALPTTTPSATPSIVESPLEESTRSSRVADLDPDARGGQADRRLSERSMIVAVEKSQDVVGMQVTLPKTFQELVDLREQVLTRVEKIDPAKRSNPAELEKQLKLLAAAPHLWPTTTRRLSSKFGYRTLWGQLEFHKGIDIPVWYGTKVMATHDGVVTVAGWQSGTGWTVGIEHDMGFSTIYGHNSQLLVSKGDEVKAGEVIALSGNSGRTTGPHVHYEIRLNGTAIDPLKYLDTDSPYVVDQ